MARARAGEVISAWLSRICSTETPPPSVVAYNVGLFETTEGFSAYLMGAESYDKKNPDWACDEVFTPRERYCPLPAKEFRGWEQVHEAVVAAVRAFLASEAGSSSFLARCEAVTVGFDGGDLERVK